MKMKIASLFMTMLLVLTLGSLAAAEELTGNDVLDNIQDSISANTSQINLRMELHSGGRTRERELEVYRQDGEEMDSSMIRFLAPASVEGTAFLSHDPHDSEDDDMYLYMPALGNVRRISGSQRNGSFVGTDFSYNDLSILGGGSYDEDYDAEILEDLGDKYLLRIIPTDEDIDYKYGYMWVQKSNWFPVEIEFYDSRGDLHKVLTSEQIVQVDGYWTAEKLTMKDVQRDTKTILFLEDIVYDQPIDDRVFTVRYLRR
ncbi:outer membrane lipoprotein-sorting protein [Halonatronum saccharophilum]|uniref:outer membrane lipoprotein-sorting protein n=1 Tax=Halonatronum saccharophilum TaxID=150060 RepID=UPI000481BF10|nr:outer membrane lipoprotein-sorting protein [Halonatronum saccharophilum]